MSIFHIFTGKDYRPEDYPKGPAVVLDANIFSEEPDLVERIIRSGNFIISLAQYREIAAPPNGIWVEPRKDSPKYASWARVQQLVARIPADKLRDVRPNELQQEWRKLVRLEPLLSKKAAYNTIVCAFQKEATSAQFTELLLRSGPDELVQTLYKQYRGALAEEFRANCKLTVDGLVVGCTRDDEIEFVSGFVTTAKRILDAIRENALHGLSRNANLVALRSAMERELDNDRKLILAALAHAGLTQKEVHILSEDRDVREMARLLHKVRAA